MIEFKSMAVTKNYLKAAHPNTKEIILRALISDQDSKIRRRVALNPKAPQEVLKALAGDPDPEVRIALANNRTTPDTILQQLASDESIYVRFGLACERTLSERLLEKLADDDNPYVVRQARRTLEGLALEKALIEAGFRREPGEEAKLGVLLNNAGLLSQAEVNHFIAVSQKLGVPLGQILARARVVPRSTIVNALSLQALVRRKQMTEAKAIEKLRVTPSSSLPLIIWDRRDSNPGPSA